MRNRLSLESPEKDVGSHEVSDVEHREGDHVMVIVAGKGANLEMGYGMNLKAT